MPQPDFLEQGAISNVWPLKITQVKKFCKLTVIGEAYRKKNVYWDCLCDCGNKTIVLGASLSNGHTTSCGCARINSASTTAKSKLSKEPHITSAKNVYINTYKDGNLTFNQFFELSQKDCHYCGCLAQSSNIYNRYKWRRNTLLENISDGNFYYNGLDRIDNTSPHDFDNVVPCCKWCNSAKMTRTTEEFNKWIENLYLSLQNRKGTD